MAVFLKNCFSASTMAFNHIAQRTSLCAMFSEAVQKCSFSTSACLHGLKGRWTDLPWYCQSIHRSRPPHYGIHRRTRVRVVDNSVLGKQAMLSGRPPYCIWVYKMGYKKRHMPKAQLGDKILVAIRGEMKRAYVVGYKTHVAEAQHGVPRTDTNNIVLLDAKENPLGTRILAPIPGCLRGHRDGNFTKVLAIATKFI